MRLYVITVAASLTLGFNAQGEPIETTTAFAMPADAENWEPEVFGQDGIYSFRQTDGTCKITFVQNRGVEAAREKGGGPRDSLDAYVEKIAARASELTRSEAPAVKLTLAPDDKVTFISEEIAYIGVDSIAYNTRLSAQWVGDVELMIIMGCASSEWPRSQDLFDAFLDKVSIMKVSAP